MEAAGGGGFAAEATNENNTENRVYGFDNNRAILSIKWDQLLAYNISFLKGKRKSTFYRGTPLPLDKVSADLIKLNEMGVFTVDVQGTELDTGYNKETGEHYEIEQRAYLCGYMPVLHAQNFILNASKDPEVIFEVSEILSGQQLYLSREIEQAWSAASYVSMTREKAAAIKEELSALPWEDFATWHFPMGGVYIMKDKNFKNWDNWVRSRLCYFFIVDKEYGQEPKSMPERLVKYLTASKTQDT